MFKQLSDDALLAELKAAAISERRGLRRFLELLLEWRRRGLDAKAASGNLYEFCNSELGLSQGESYKRARTVDAARRYPFILDLIESGRIHVSAVAVLSAHLTPENAADLFAKAEGLSMRELEKMVASFSQPQPRPRDVIKPMAPIRRKALHEEEAQLTFESAMPDQEPARNPSEEIGASRVTFTADAETLEDLEKAKALLSHRVVAGELGPIFKTALRNLVKALDPAEWGAAVRRPILPGRRRVPRWVRREVWKRDGGRCAYIDAAGDRCASRRWLEYDHIHPFSLGGRSDESSNVRLLCRAHNQEAARQAGLI